MIKRLLPIILLAVCCGRSPESPLIPDPDLTLPLYPQGQSVDRGIVEDGVSVTLGPGADNHLKGSMETDGNLRYSNIGDDAFISIWLPEKCNGKMIVICPGGAYSVCCGGHEGTGVAKWCLDRGIAACMLIYRLPNGNGEIPLRDVQNALRYCRYHSSEWGVSEIGVMGFSAGGHLAGAASTLYEDVLTRPDFSILIYGALDPRAFDDTEVGIGFIRNFTGGNPEMYERFIPVKHVTDDTPPALLLLSGDDSVVPPANSIGYYNELSGHGVLSEIHILAEGDHGWGFPVQPDGEDPLSPKARQTVDGILENWLDRSF